MIHNGRSMTMHDAKNPLLAMGERVDLVVGVGPPSSCFGALREATRDNDLLDFLDDLPFDFSVR